MPQEIGWSVEAKLLYQIKQLTRALNSRTYIAVFPNLASFPNPGITGTLYVDESTGDIYVWNGTNYVLLSSGITALNGLIAAAQTFATGTSGADFNISSVGTTHTFNFPTASAVNRGLLSSTDWTTFNSKIGGTGTVNYVPKFTASGTIGNSQIFDDGTNVGVGTASPWAKLSIGFSSSLSFGSSSFPFSVSRSSSGNLVTTFADGYDNTNARVDFTMRNGSANVTTPLSITGGGRIGIGTTTPTYKLDVRGGGIFYDGGGTGGTTTYSYLNGQGGLELKGATSENIRYEGTHLTFQNGSTERMRITAAGDVGIGTTSPLAYGAGFTTLTVNGSTGGILTMRNNNVTFHELYSSGNDVRYEIPVTRNWVFRTSNGFERMLITGAGNVGIGTTSPNQPLQVIGAIDVRDVVGTGGAGVGVEIQSNASQPRVSLRTGNQYRVEIFSDVTNAGIRNISNQALQIWTNNTERARFTDVGNLLIGTTTDGGQRLQVSGITKITASANYPLIVATTTQSSSTAYTSTGGDFYVGIDSVNGSAIGSNVAYGRVVWSQGAYPLLFGTNSIERIRITSAGDVGIGTTSPSEALHVVGRGRFTTIDNNASPTFFLTSDANGVIQKSTYVPTGGSGTTNYVPKFTASGTIGNSQIFDNGTNVGIGTTSPAARLDIRGANEQKIYLITTTAANIDNSIESYFNSGGGWSNLVTRSQTIQFNTSPASGPQVERMRITSAGRLLVGTSTEGTNTVDIAGTLRSTGTATVGSSSGGLIVGATTSPALQGRIVVKYQGGINFENQAATGTSGYLESTTSDGLQLGNNNASLLLERVSGNFIFNNGGSGNIGVGIASPLDKVDINGSIRFRANTANFVASQGGVIDFVPTSVFPTTPTVRIYSIGDASNAGWITFGTGTTTGASERMRITSAGDLAIGSTSADPFARNDDRRVSIDASGISSTANLALSLNAGATAGRGAQIYLGGGGTRWAELSSNANESRLTVLANTPLAFSTNNTERMRLTAAGQLLVNTTVTPGAGPTVVIGSTANQPSIALYDAGSPVDQKTAVIQSGSAVSDAFRIRFTNDAVTTGQNAYIITRSGIQPQTHEWITGTSERMRITSGGNVLIGTTTDGGQMLQVSGTTLLSNTVTFANTNTGGVSWGNPSINGGSQIFFRSLTTNWVGLINSSSHGIFITNTNANVLIGNLYSDSVGGVRTIVHNNGTAPTGNVTDSYQLYSADVVAGNAAPHFRTENGAVVKVYQETTGVGAATLVGGGGTNITDTDTFDGYTLKQIVKALRNQGLLA